MSHPADAARGKSQERRMIPSKWCNTCQSWRHTSDCGRDDCPGPPADAGAVSPQPTDDDWRDLYWAVNAAYKGKGVTRLHQMLDGLRAGSWDAIRPLLCQLCRKPQPCPEHGRTPVTDQDFDELQREVSLLPSKVSAEYPNKAAGGTEAAGLLHPSTAIHVSMASGAMNDYTADQLCPKCGVVRPCYAHEPERLRELYTVRTGAPLTRQGADLDLEKETWFINLHQAVRDLVERQSNRGNRAHLLASIDEAVRRLRSLAVPQDPTPEVEAKRLRKFIRKYTSGQCKMWSQGDACKCPLCDVDRLVRASRASLAVPATEPPDNALKIAIAELAGYRDGFEGLPYNATFSTQEENIAYHLYHGIAYKERMTLVEHVQTLERLLKEARAGAGDRLPAPEAEK